MILESFEIENWACIKKLMLNNLPPSGVIVLHGPNRTGKSSLVRALRACLADYPSTTTAAAVRDCFPRGTGEKPVVSVVFSVRDTAYRIKKWYGSNRSEFASRTSTGDWRVETTSAADCHQRVCECAGGDDSSKGLRQLLWLTQAEFRLPKPNQFDASVQAQLRNILGVLQTPLDDQFIQRVKQRWNVWHSGQRRVGIAPQIKNGCRLKENFGKLENLKNDWCESEAKFQEMERLLREAESLDARARDLKRQMDEQKGELQNRREEHDRSQGRIIARKLAEERFENAKKEQRLANEEQAHRAEVAQRMNDALMAVQPGKEKVADLERNLRVMEEEQRQRRADLNEKRDMRAELSAVAQGVASRLRTLDDCANLSAAQEELEKALEIANGVDALKEYLDNNPSPDKKQLDILKTNRREWQQLQADRDAASMGLRLIPVEGASTAQLALDGAAAQPLEDSPQPHIYSVRRKIDLFVPNWGRIEVTRGESRTNLDEIDGSLNKLTTEFVDAVARFGISGSEADALDQVIRRCAERETKNDQLREQEKVLKKMAPRGLDPLRSKVRELETKLKDHADLLEQWRQNLGLDQRSQQKELAAELEKKISSLQEDIELLEADIETAAAHEADEREAITEAKEELASREAMLRARHEELERLPTIEQIDHRVMETARNLEEAIGQLGETELTSEESTIAERLAACEESVRALDQQIRENSAKYHTLKGRLEGSEGLHASRAARAARLEQLTRDTNREDIERQALDRIYGLFEECRDRQIGTLLAPVHDRVVSWMRVLDIGDYKEMQFNDSFLPEKLYTRDGTAEFKIDEESTGAQEQIGMLVRLALGSLITRDCPTVAILDDPLTHCDVGRLSKMRAILRRASQGDIRSKPQAGPLQIVVLTCHPEWFRDEHTLVIDLDSEDIMQRFPR